MARLSRVFSKKRCKNNQTNKSTLMDRMTSRQNSSMISDNNLLGDLFITTDMDNIVDLTQLHKPIVSRLKTSTKITNLQNKTSIAFDGKDANLNILDNGNFNFNIDDFSIDWWEYQLPEPDGWELEVATTQYIVYKNSIDKKAPLQISNSPDKTISISSDGSHWDISDNRYIGTVDYNKWTHWAIVRANNNFYTFKNGAIKNIWSSSKAINSSDGYLTFGSNPKGNNFYGYLDKIRIIKGTSLWTDEFKPTKEDLFY